MINSTLWLVFCTQFFSATRAVNSVVETGLNCCVGRSDNALPCICVCVDERLTVRAAGLTTITHQCPADINCRGRAINARSISALRSTRIGRAARRTRPPSTWQDSPTVLTAAGGSSAWRGSRSRRRCRRLSSAYGIIPSDVDILIS